MFTSWGFVRVKISFLHLPETLGLSEDEGLGLGPLLLNDMKRCWQNSSGSSLSRNVCMKTLKPSKSISWKATSEKGHVVCLKMFKEIQMLERMLVCFTLRNNLWLLAKCCRIYVTALCTHKDVVWAVGDEGSNSAFSVWAVVFSTGHRSTIEAENFVYPSDCLVESETRECRLTFCL